MKKEISFVAALASICAVAPAFSQEVAATVPSDNAATNAIVAETGGIVAEAKISRVVVFPRGAKITRTARVKVHAGAQEIIVAGTPRGLPLRVSSFSASLRLPGARVATVSPMVDFSPAATDSVVAAAFEKYREKQLVVERLAATKLALETYRERLIDAPNPTTEAKKTPPAFDAAAFSKALRFCEEENRKTLEEISVLDDKLELARIDLDVAKSEYDKLESSARQATQTVRVKIVADNDAEGEIDLSYDSPNASWRPSYDVVVDPEKKTATIVAYGVVSQQTGEDWNNVLVTLSTAFPDADADLPEFRKILVTERFPQRDVPMPLLATDNNAAQPTARMATRAMGATNRKAAKVEVPPQSRTILGNGGESAIILADGTTIENASDIRYRAGNYIFKSNGEVRQVSGENVRALSQEFVETGRLDIAVSRLLDPSRNLHGLDFRYELARAATIESTGMPRRYLLSSETFAGDFFCRVIPAQTERAYQMLAVTNGNFRPILAGPANIFYGADFIGDMDIPFTENKGVVEIPLGIDPRISVERQKINSVETVGTFTSSRRNSVAVSVKIRNRTPEQIRVVCDDAIPVSTQAEIEVSPPDFSPSANLDEKTGIAQWDVKIAPNAEIELCTKYKIDYPKDFAIEETEHAQAAK
ncbi:MAG: DUF4139 domain-containing protein [Opitutae bacterium]|nr:DUF4139 domain-containing protein [Opitutae bacterium]